jgi:hypothetical protein
VWWWCAGEEPSAVRGNGEEDVIALEAMSSVVLAAVVPEIDGTAGTGGTSRLLLLVCVRIGARIRDGRRDTFASYSAFLVTGSVGQSYSGGTLELMTNFDFGTFRE